MRTLRVNHESHLRLVHFPACRKFLAIVSDQAAFAELEIEMCTENEIRCVSLFGPSEFLAHEDRNELCVQQPCAESTLHYFRLTVQTPSQKKLTPIHTKATLQPYRTTATLTDTEHQPDGQNEELQRRHDKDGALDRRVTTGRFRRKKSNRVQTGTSVLLRMTPNQHVRGSSVLRLCLRWNSRGTSRSCWSVQDPF